MNNITIIMKNEISSVSKYRALIISKYYLTIILSLVTIYLGMIRYAVSSLYILLMLQILPPIIAAALKDYSQKHKNKSLENIVSDSPFHLNYIKSKYKYSRLIHLSNEAAYFISIILICLWQFNYSHTEVLNVYLRRLPMFVLLSGLTLRFFAVIFYRIKLPFDLLNNRL